MKLNEWILVEVENKETEKYQTEIFIGSTANEEVRDFIVETMTGINLKMKNNVPKPMVYVDNMTFSFQDFWGDQEDILDMIIHYGSVEYGPLEININWKGSYKK